jgi:methyl-accepting chemotaxis protein
MITAFVIVILVAFNMAKRFTEFILGYYMYSGVIMERGETNALIVRTSPNLVDLPRLIGSFIEKCYSDFILWFIKPEYVSQISIIIAVTAAIGLSLTMSRIIGRHSADITRALDDLSAGNHNVRISSRFQIFGNLAQSFNFLAEKINTSEYHRKVDESSRKQLNEEVSEDIIALVSTIKGYSGVLAELAEQDGHTQESDYARQITVKAEEIEERIRKLL